MELGKSPLIFKSSFFLSKLIEGTAANNASV